MVRTIGLSICLLIASGPSKAFAWGCDGHQAVAIIAERLLSPPALKAIEAVLAASPVDPALRPFCPPLPLDPIADAATWADDNRALDPSTANWHFINFPLAAGRNTSNYKTYCPMGNCVIDAIVAQYHTLTTSSDARAKGNALRYLIHFVGDLHQPLHTTTNGDRGGNCTPVAYFGEAPQEDDRHNWRPNLHGVWDDSTIRRLMRTKGLGNSRDLAEDIVRQAPPRPVSPQTPTPSRVAAWARDTGTLARTIAYGKLPMKPPTETAAALASCDDHNHVGQRLAGLHEQIDASYERASVPVIVSQIRLAGERLAAVLKAAFPAQR